jgi:hypothetical protein
LRKTSRLQTALLDMLKNDPEWAAYVADLSPSTPLRKAVDDYLRFVRERVALTDEESAFADEILAMMAERGYKTPEKVAEAIESGAISLADLAMRLRTSTA